MEEMLKELAMVHEKQECVGLPYCAACRAVILLRFKMDIEPAEEQIARTPQGTKVYLEKE